MAEKGLKLDGGKQQWFAMPLTILKPLADVFAAGERKYSIFNCLQPFDGADRRFWDATMRHLDACQIDPLAIDEETGCYHAAQAAFNILLRVHNVKNQRKEVITTPKNDKTGPPKNAGGPKDGRGGGAGNKGGQGSGKQTGGRRNA
jgi:hypothetical protein